MTDQERALALARAVVDEIARFDIDQPAPAVDRAAPLLAAALAAVRADERRAVVALLGRRGSDPRRSATGCAALHEAADAIEHGEHVREARS